MSTPRIFPEGPILPSDTFTFVAIINGEFYAMVIDTTLSTPVPVLERLYLEQGPGFPLILNNLITSSTIAQFRFTGTLTNMSITLVSPQTAAGNIQPVTFPSPFVNGDGVMSIRTDTNLPIIATSNYQPHSNMLLSGAMYNFSVIGNDGNNSSQPLFTIYNTNINLQGINTQLIPIGMAAYYRTNNCSPITDPLTIVQLSYCSICSTLNPIAGTNRCSNCQATPEPGWTNANDCNVGINYNYCLTGVFCGGINSQGQKISNDCFGPCLDDGQCTFNTSAASFACPPAVINPPIPPWYQSTWFIVLVVTMIIIIIIIIVVVARNRGNDRVSRSHYDIRNNGNNSYASTSITTHS